MQVNLNEVSLPKDFQKRYEGLLEDDWMRLVGKIYVLDKKEIVIDEVKAKEILGQKKKSEVYEILENEILVGIKIYLENKFWIEAKKKVEIPYEDRKKMARVQTLVYGSEGGFFELTSELVDFIIDSLKDKSNSSVIMVYIVDYLEELKIKNKE